MKDTDISSPEELDAALAHRAMFKEEKLWRAAEGRTFLIGDVIGCIVGALLIVVGFYGVEQPTGGLFYLLLGLALVASTMFRRQQAQINALRRLLKHSTARD